jgi:hypothetical protein
LQNQNRRRACCNHKRRAPRVHWKRNPHFVADYRAVAALSKDQTERWHCFRINFGRDAIDRARKSELF